MGAEARRFGFFPTCVFSNPTTVVARTIIAVSSLNNSVQTPWASPPFGGAARERDFYSPPATLIVAWNALKRKHVLVHVFHHFAPAQGPGHEPCPEKAGSRAGWSTRAVCRDMLVRL